MLKLFAVLFNFLVILLMTFILPNGVLVYMNIDNDQVFVQDSVYLVEITIKKGGVFGFAKFQQTLPEGFIAEPVNTSEGSFTFADNKVKFIWMALPEDEEIHVSYNLRATEGASLNGVIEGKFSYIEDNERKSYDVPNVNVSVTTDKPEISKAPILASVNRIVTELGNNEYNVSLTITKQGVEGFAKVEEFLPNGAMATVDNNNKAVFSQVDDKAKFVWMAIPEEKELKVSYNVQSSEDISKALSAMEGGFSYLDNNETKTVAIKGIELISPTVAEITEIQPQELEIAKVTLVEPLKAESTAKDLINEDVPREEPKQEIATVEPVKTETSNPEKPAITVVTKTETSKTSNPSEPSLINIPKPETGVSFKVQIAAGHKQVSNSYIQEHYKFEEPFILENHEGWIKYTTGNFSTYNSARDKRETLIAEQHNFPGPFVTAYNSGQRITVQEALMISNQKWVQ